MTLLSQGLSERGECGGGGGRAERGYFLCHKSQETNIKKITASRDLSTIHICITPNIFSRKFIYDKTANGMLINPGIVFTFTLEYHLEIAIDEMLNTDI